MEQQTFQSARFLIVDDEPANIVVVEMMLEQWGCSYIATTTDPYTALSLFCEFRPDVILLDLMMPGLDGFQIMEQLKPLIPLGSFLPILVLTADTSAQVKEKALSAGAKDFLTKPFDYMELFLRVRNLVETRFLHLQLQDQNRNLEEIVEERTEQLQQSEIETLECLAMAAEYRDDNTGQHTQRVSLTASLLARRLGIYPRRVDLIRRASPLHDVGKIGIPDSILLKPGKLTAAEFCLMKTHTSIGFNILARHHTPLLQLAAEIALSHHERWDGLGYPQGLMGNACPLEGRILAVADVFDALTHERPYKQAWPLEVAVTEIERQSDRQFDPYVVKAFLAHLNEIQGIHRSYQEDRCKGSLSVNSSFKCDAQERIDTSHFP